MQSTELYHKCMRSMYSPFNLGLGVPKAGLGSFTNILEPAVDISNTNKLST